MSFLVAVVVNSPRSLDPWTLQDRSSPCPHPWHPCTLSWRPGHISRPHTPSVAELSARPAGWDCQGLRVLQRTRAPAR